MTQSGITQRLKIIIESLGLDTRSFSQALGVSEGTTRNYFNRGSKPNAEYLEKISVSFESVNLHWLLTGRGEPLLPPLDENEPKHTHNQKFFRSPVIGNNQGVANQQQNINPNTEQDSTKNELALAKQEIENLRDQLASKEALLTAKDVIIAGKDELLAFLRGGHNRPN